MRLVGPVGMLALVFTAGAAHATPSARLVYTRSEDAALCPDEAALHKAVAARFGYDPFFAWARQTIVVQIWREQGRYMARVQLVNEQGVARGTREIRSDGEDCPDLFGAAALAISIALDASASATAAVDAPDASPPLATPPELPPAPTPAPAPARIDERPSEAPTDAAVLAARATDGALRTGIGALASTFIGPKLAPGIVVFGDVRSHAVSLGVELQADVSTPADVNLPESAPSTGQIASALFAAAVVPCAHYRRVFGCALGEIGWLQAWGWGVAQGGSSGTPFVGVGARAGAEWPLSRRLFVRVHVDALANLDRATLELDGQRVWSVPPFGGALGVGLGASLP